MNNSNQNEGKKINKAAFDQLHKESVNNDQIQTDINEAYRQKIPNPNKPPSIAIIEEDTLKQKDDLNKNIEIPSKSEENSLSLNVSNKYNVAPGQTSSLSEDTNTIRPAYLNSEDTATALIWRICKAKTQKFFKKVTHLATNRTLRIGISARIFHPEPGSKGLRGKTLQYLEECLAHWVMSRDVLVFMIPTVAKKGSVHYSNISLHDYAKHLDGLVLQGGADVSPLSYGEKATQSEWIGDQVRDLYELDLCRSFIELGKPVLGICRGCQLINVAFGGSLYQDIASEHPNPEEHVKESYDLHHHTIELTEGSSFSKLFNKSSEKKRWVVNSIHHQAVKTLGKNIEQEAFSVRDGITEAIRYTKAPFVVGIQWHPEFQQVDVDNLLDCTPLLDQFLRAARETRF